LTSNNVVFNLIINAYYYKMKTQISMKKFKFLFYFLSLTSLSINSQIHHTKIEVVAHRGDWRNAPENSLNSIVSAIEMGADVVEVDVRVTKDKKLVLMHDELLDRTTNGKGKIEEFTLQELKKLNLKDGAGSWTDYKIPTLKEALLVAKNKIQLNIDLKDNSQLIVILQLVDDLNMFNEVIFKLKGNLKEAQTLYGPYLNKIKFMPIIVISENNSEKILNEYLEATIGIEAFELLLEKESDKFNFFKEKIKEKKKKIWINSLWASMCAGFNDEKAFYDINTYQWYIQNNIDYIQTDRPALLLDFLRKN